MITIEFKHIKLEVLSLGDRWHWANMYTSVVEEFTIHPNSWSEESQHNYHKKYDKLGVPRCKVID